MILLTPHTIKIYNCLYLEIGKMLQNSILTLVLENLLNMYFVTEFLVHTAMGSKHLLKICILVIPFEVVEKLQNDKSCGRQL